MKKQGLQFFMLRTLAEQLQGWADFVSRQIGEEAHPLAQTPANAVQPTMGSVADTPRAESVSEGDMENPDADNPPVYWMELTDVNEPPAHWLARVQKDASEPLQGKERINRVPQSRSLPTMPADAGVRPNILPGEPERIQGPSRQSSESHMRESEEAQEHENRLHAPASRRNRPDSPNPLPPEQAKNGRMRQPVDAVVESNRLSGRQLGQSDGVEKRGEHQDNARPNTQLNMQPNAQPSASNGNDAPQAYNSLVAQAPHTVQTTETGNAQGTSMGEIIAAKMTSNQLTTEMPRRVDSTPPDLQPLPATSGSEDSLMNWHSPPATERFFSDEQRDAMGRGRQETGSTFNDQLPVDSIVSTERRVSSSSIANASPWEERRGMSAYQEIGEIPQPFANSLASTQSHRLLSAEDASRQTTGLPQWPALPVDAEEDAATASQHWEMLWRARERQQRLDEEQRGSSWSA